MIDFHCHLDLYPDPHAVIAEVTRRRMYVLSVTTVPSAFEGTAALAGKNPRIRTALGLHPEVAVARKRELGLFESNIDRTRFVGEVGLDGSRDHKATLDEQTEILRQILGICRRHGSKIISLHSRGAAKRLLDVLSDHSDAGQFVLHWFGGTVAQVQRAAELGAWFSVGPSMLNSARGREIVGAMPRDRVLTESDGPFASIANVAVKPWDAWLAVPMLSAIWAEDPSETERRVAANFRTLSLWRQETVQDFQN